MLIRLTNQCQAGCSHCLIDASGPDGAHMTEETFRQTVALAQRLGVRVLVLSGGEPTEHPEIAAWLMALNLLRLAYPHQVVLASNGRFALEPRLYQQLVQVTATPGNAVQVTCDPRFYTRDLSLIRHQFDRPGWSYTDRLPGGLMPCRRVQAQRLAATGAEIRTQPACANLVVNTARSGFLRALGGLERVGRACSPSVNVDGTVRLGEMDTCTAIGTVESRSEELEQAVRELAPKLRVNRGCNRCGLWGNVAAHVKALIPSAAPAKEKLA